MHEESKNPEKKLYLTAFNIDDSNNKCFLSSKFALGWRFEGFCEEWCWNRCSFDHRNTLHLKIY